MCGPKPSRLVVNGERQPRNGVAWALPWKRAPDSAERRRKVGGGWRVGLAGWPLRMVWGAPGGLPFGAPPPVLPPLAPQGCSVGATEFGRGAGVAVTKSEALLL